MVKDVIDAPDTYQKISTGADVEFFFKNSDENVVPSDKILPLKDEPLRARPGQESFLHVDGIQGELTVLHSHCRAYVLDRLHAGLRLARQVANENNLTLSLQSSVDTPAELLENASPVGVAFGCDPDFNAWEGGTVNLNEIDPKNHFVRYAGCHIHVGTPEYDKSFDAFLGDPEVKNALILLMDILIGSPLSLIERIDSSNTRRRDVFGKAGCYRPTPYGVEYRVPGATMLAHPFLYEWAMGMARRVVGLLYYDKKHGLEKVMNRIGNDPAVVIAAINEGNLDAAWHIVNATKDILNQSQGFSTLARFIQDPKTVIGGFEEEHIVKNWQLRTLKFSHGVSTSSGANLVNNRSILSTQLKEKEYVLN